MSSNNRHPNRHNYNIAVFGIGGVGKSCVTVRFVHDTWITTYDPTIEDSYRAHIQVDGHHISLDILDTGGGGYSEVAIMNRQMTISLGFILIFSLTSSASLKKIAELYENIIRIKGDKDTPIVIVGNKADQKDDRVVQQARACSVVQGWGSYYYESSAKTSANIDEAFFGLCRQMLQKDEDYRACLENEVGGTELGATRHRSKFRKTKGLQVGNGGRCAIL